MFAIAKSRALPVEVDIPVIVDGYEVLHFDQQPILFTGYNAAGSRLLGSFVEEDLRAKVVRYFFTIVPIPDYAAFVAGAITYRDILLRGRMLFVVDERYDKTRRGVFLVEVGKIPPHLLPTEESYFPRPHSESSLVFGAKLRGSIADSHRADPADLRVLEDCLPALAGDGVRILNLKDLGQRVTIQPYQGGSFDLGFALSTQWEGTLPLFNADEHRAFAVQYVDYCINHFHQEAEELAEGKQTTRFAELLRSYKTLARGVKQGEHASELLRGIRRSLERLHDLAEIMGPNFTSLELRNITDAGDMIVGILDKQVAENIALSAERFDVRTGDVREDSSDVTFTLVVYSLNAESRRGQAYVETDDAKSLHRARFRILGIESLKESPFTASLDKGQKICVQGRGRYVSGKIQTLTVVADPRLWSMEK